MMARFQPGNQYGRRWTPGQSGNPAGRPRIKPLRAAARRLLAETDGDGRDKAEALILRIYEYVMTNKPSNAIHWARLLIEITDGKPGRDDDDEPMSRSDGGTDGRGPGHEEKS